jgi:TatD DNase family protein
MLVDTHAHLDFPDYGDDLPQVLERASAAGVSRIINISTSLASSVRSIALAESHHEIFAAIGVHPCNVDESPDEISEPLRQLLAHPKVVALGETGLDYHRAEHPPEESHARHAWEKNRIRQARFFSKQLSIAEEHGLSVVVHQRDSWEDTLKILRPFSGRIRAVFHCFGGTLTQAEELLSLGFRVSFTGIATFKNAASVHQTVAKLPQGTFFLETDCPFLAPTPHRGKRCEPAHTRLIAEHIARLRGETLEELAAHTTAAANSFFSRSLVGTRSDLIPETAVPEQK